MHLFITIVTVLAMLAVAAFLFVLALGDALAEHYGDVRLSRRDRWASNACLIASLALVIGAGFVAFG